MRKFIVAAIMAMASPAWACVIGEPGWLDKCDKEFAQAGGACTGGILTEGECVKGGGGGGGGSGRIPPMVICSDPHKIAVNGKCVDGMTFPDITSQPASPTCPTGYALLAYPGTWTLVCARDLQAPK